MTEELVRLFLSRLSESFCADIEAEVNHRIIREVTLGVMHLNETTPMWFERLRNANVVVRMDFIGQDILTLAYGLDEVRLREYVAHFGWDFLREKALIIEENLSLAVINQYGHIWMAAIDEMRPIWQAMQNTPPAREQELALVM